MSFRLGIMERFGGSVVRVTRIVVFCHVSERVLVGMWMKSGRGGYLRKYCLDLCLGLVRMGHHGIQSQRVDFSF